MGSMPGVMADEQCGRVFQNLIGNALNYRGSKIPEIEVPPGR